MCAVDKKINSDELVNLVNLQGAELRRKSAEIDRLKQMLEEQANQLIQSRTELNTCRKQLAIGAAA